MGVPDRSFHLKPLGSKPSVHQAEVPAAMVVLLIVDSPWQALHENRTVLGPTVSDTGEKFCEMDRRVGLVADTHEEDTAVPIEDATDWAGDTMRRERDRIRCDLRRNRPSRGEGERVVAAQYTGESPERVRDNSEVRVSGRGRRVEQSVVFSGIRRHDKRALRAHCLLQSCEQARGSAFDRSHGAIGDVHQHHIARPDSEGCDLTCNVRRRPRALTCPMQGPLASRLGRALGTQGEVCQTCHACGPPALEARSEPRESHADPDSRIRGGHNELLVPLPHEGHGIPTPASLALQLPVHECPFDFQL